VHQEAIAEILRDITAEALDHRGTGFMVGPHDLPQVLRIELDSESSRVHEIAEHHCKLTSFGFRYTSHDVGGLTLGGLIFLGVKLLCKAGGLEGGLWSGWGCWYRSSRPDQDSAVLVVRQLLGLDEFDLEFFEVGVVQLKPPLQGTIRDPALALEECDGLLQNFLELHDRPSTCTGDSTSTGPMRSLACNLRRWYHALQRKERMRAA